jgi:hypothetical protein
MTALTVGAWVIALVDLRGFSRRLPETSLGFYLLFGVVVFGALEFKTGLMLMSSLLAVTVTVVVLLVTAVCTPTAGGHSLWTRRGAMLLAGALIGVLVAESAFRMVLLQSVFPVTEAQFTDVIAREWPRKISVAREPQVPRILGLADSFGTAGQHGNYHYLVEALLNKGGRRVEVVNISVGGLEPGDELTLLKRFGPRYRPDLVLHGIFVGNDFWTPAGDLMVYHKISLRTEPGLRAFRPDNLALARWLRNYMIALSDVRERQDAARRGQAGGTFSESQFLRVESTAMTCCRVRSDTQEYWRRTIAIIDQIRRVVQDDMGARYAIVVHPDVLQVDDDLRRSVLAHSGEDPRSFDFELPQKSVLAYCARSHIPCLDLLPVFRGSSPPRALYLLRDTHYNAEGNTLAAQALAEFLPSVVPLPAVTSR